MSHWAPSNPWRNYYQSDPSAYMPPYGYPDPPRFASVKYPKLFHLLASDTTRLRFDVRKPPKEINATTFFANRHISATESGAKRLRLISKSFPWTIDIESPVSIICEAVWEALYQGLQEPIADSEWGMILHIKRQRDVVEKAAKRRLDSNRDDDVKLRRVDFLGEATLFKGLDKDENFESVRLLPGMKDAPDTWVVSLGT